MKLGASLSHRQTQKLVMTQDLRQSIELLSLSTLELSDKIQNELLENPLLDELGVDEKTKMPELFSIDEVKRLEKLNHEKSTDVNWQDSYSLEGPRTYDSEASDRNQKYIESSTRGETLEEHLLNQLRLIKLTKLEFEIGEVLISMIDDKGFITDDLTLVAKEMGYPEPKLRRVLQVINELDPIGIGAKDMQETLLIQGRILFPENTLLHQLIGEFLSDLEKVDYKKIAKNLKITEEEILSLARLIKKLEPYPATTYQGRKIDYVVADVVVKEVGNEFNIFINDEWLPKLTIQEEYKELLGQKLPPKEKEYFQTKYSSAQWLIRSIQQRRQTLQRVVSCIIDFQVDFFRGGIGFIKPLTLKEVAEKLGLHESTISRITTNKYIQTTWGIFELKWFFSSGVKSAEGGKESSKKIHEIIRNLVKEEDEQNPLSDQDIVELMEKKGIEIARRTVAKYRKVLRILPSNERKRISSLKG
ncbi:RNA polymerase sigma-54 factor [Leptospira biflexa]|uniref:RNA polymerase sigma-54 factor n=1 Tax=Leptospira biflexa serovar Patoc (strain Patoc 1 / ATCC 23582 / Paris) TaxID=456481 RepID=B0SR56_LEPBP|nr:RNA polymerase factor sigma-54 [Leptospira biflexa]ABZ94108.1 DNA-directed RNA polymerase sigma-54 subunit [Leptospira biflexa serovar Patoc strain 'Patoc 1 (Ames)']ABZ97757.1 RNA polymerase sigma-54 factor [Leptospira biflexa serovar Patoc strain 'Patoc 1 (Paris)']TGM48479.1 RNA polymerase sigma-54 factor [Leptospira biflexa]TGM49056.1 RNA polymerase sigma-54 factor [Leptospira biflexa]